MTATPLLFYGISFLLGIAGSMFFHPVYLVILAVMIWFWRNRWLPALSVALSGYIFAACSVSLPTLPEDGTHVQGKFIPSSLSYSHSPFGTSYLLKGSLNRIPCQIYFPKHKSRPSCDHSFYVEGKLLPKKFPNYVLKPTLLEPIPNTFSLAEWRFQLKDGVRNKFKALFSSPETSAFLLSMVTGELDDRLMSLQFNRLGLLHLLGVSGFQFSLLALLLGGVLKIILPGNKGTALLILFLSIYAFTLGHSPPIERAWVGSILFAIARRFGLPLSPLNSLGAALIFCLLLDPCVIFQLGFQFSFLCTGAIFIIYPVLRQFMMRFLPARSLSEIRLLPLIDRVGLVVTSFCRESIALNVAIHLVSLPLIFLHFHKFPLLSLAYNLFLPPVVSLAYLFLILGFLFPPFLWISGTITTSMIHVAQNPPTLFDFQWRFPSLTLGWAILSMTLILWFFYKRSRFFNSTFGT